MFCWLLHGTHFLGFHNTFDSFPWTVMSKLAQYKNLGIENFVKRRAEFVVVVIPWSSPQQKIIENTVYNIGQFVAYPACSSCLLSPVHKSFIACMQCEGKSCLQRACVSPMQIWVRSEQEGTEPHLCPSLCSSMLWTHAVRCSATSSRPHPTPLPGIGGNWNIFCDSSNHNLLSNPFLGQHSIMFPHTRS